MRTEHEEQRDFVKWFRQSFPATRIFAIPNGGTFGNVSISVISKKGTIDYKRIVTELKPDIDLEAYRGKPSNYYKVTIHDGSEEAGKQEAE